MVKRMQHVFLLQDCRIYSFRKILTAQTANNVAHHHPEINTHVHSLKENKEILQKTAISMIEMVDTFINDKAGCFVDTVK